MNSSWNKNLELFRQRFPALAQNLAPQTNPDIITEPAKNGDMTAKCGNLMLHSKYNPVREAESFISSFDKNKHETVIFLGFGLGHGPVAFAKSNPDATMVLIEKDSSRFFSALEAIDWTPVFKHKNLVLVLEANEEETCAVIAGFKADATCLLKSKPQTAYNEAYFDSVEKAFRQNSQKDEINTNTLEKFAKLWLNNSCRNLDCMSVFDGIEKYSGIGKGIPFVIIAAGPSLSGILEHLAEIKKRAFIVCVDTALHACLKHNVEPDFIILTDPQYYCAMHLQFLESPSSVLITEIAAYPSVLRFKCKETVLFSSLFPIGQFFEGKTRQKGKLAAGGSVTTSAWDFARLCGADRIFIAGMDLGFPGKETHIRGSRFEEKAHATSNRLETTEKANIASLFSASPSWAKDYNGNPILTDKRMSLFSWWFENQCTAARKSGISTYSLTARSQAIKGIDLFKLEDFLLLPEIQKEKQMFFSQAETRRMPLDEKEKFKTAKEQFTRNLDHLEVAAKKGIDAASKAIKDRTKLPQSLAKLDEADKSIMHSEAKDAASLVFPTKRQLDVLAKEIPQSTELEKNLYPIQYSKLVYTQLLASIKLFKKFFSSL
ncbi:MAG: motility associated factor glycosyltransferase family protein [Treponema sp.]|nr:motility associated factor glycosyltransferase family protein [Candidatus Treponema equi]